MRARLRRLFRSDRGFSTAAVFILALPLLVGAFGLGVDTVRLVYIQNYLQGRADLATQSAVTTSYTNTSNRLVYLGAKSDGGTGQVSLDRALAVYKSNTLAKRNNGFLSPLTGSNGSPAIVTFGSPRTAAQLCLPASDPRSQYGVTLTVGEKIPTTFLKILNIQSMDITIKSTALVRGRNC